MAPTVYRLAPEAFPKRRLNHTGSSPCTLHPFHGRPTRLNAPVAFSCNARERLALSG